jgi:hypothetical protein
MSLLYYQTKEHGTHVAFEKEKYTFLKPYQQCIKLASEYNNAYDYEYSFPFIKNPTIPNLYEIKIWNGKDKNEYTIFDKVIKININNINNIAISRVDLVASNDHDNYNEPILLSRYEPSKHENSSFIYIQSTGIPTIAMEYAKLQLNVYGIANDSFDILKFNATCQLRILSLDIMRREYHIVHEIQTWNLDIKSKIYIGSGYVHKDKIGCCIC